MLTLIVQSGLLLVMSSAQADTGPGSVKKPEAAIVLSPLLRNCLADCEHGGQAKDCFDYCFSKADNGNPSAQHLALKEACGNKVGPALSDCLNQGRGPKSRVREAQLHPTGDGGAAR